MLDASEESTSRASARMRMRRKQIIEVTMTFKLTLSETHSTASRIGIPLCKDAPGMALSTTATIENTAKKKRPEDTIMSRPLH